jgi:hypothetical protein
LKYRIWGGVGDTSIVIAPQICMSSFVL